MDIQTRKLEFIQEFLNLTNEKSIKRLEKQLKEEVSIYNFDLKKRIHTSENDFEDGKTITNSELIEKYNG